MDHLPPNDQAIHDRILSDLPTAEAPAPIRAVYFLIRGGVIVYVGQTTHLIQRLISHENEGAKKYDAVRYWHLPTENLNVIERELVWRLNPEYNGKFVRGKKPKNAVSINRHILSKTVSVREVEAE